MKKKRINVFPIVRRIIGIALIVLIIGSISVMATNFEISNVKIIFSNGYEMEVMTSKLNVREILSENHIVLLPDEKVNPGLDEDLSDNKTIIISLEEIVKVEESEKPEEIGKITKEEILSKYDNIVEKIETVTEEIPFETITKDVSNESSDKKDVVVQNGSNGIKEVTYKVKYQNDIEIERIKISEVVIREAIDKIVEVRKRISVTTRYAEGRISSSKWAYDEDELDLLCAITAQEGGGSYESALAVMTCACNRAEINWGRHGSDPLSQYKAKGQFCYSIDNYWRKRLNGNYASYVKQAVLDALNGKRNHTYLSFRSAGYGYSGVNIGVDIGGNRYFSSM